MVPSSDITLAVIGGGRMGEAMVAGWIASGFVEASRVTVAEPSAERRAQLEHLGVRLVADGAQALPADVVVLAVKPQVLEAVVRTLPATAGSSLIVSVAAGISCAKLESMLPASTAVVRVMPNTPAMVSAGMAVISGGEETTVEQIELVDRMFGLIGETAVVDERYQNACAAISGSGPAYFALVIDALARAGVRVGLNRELAQKLAVQTMSGTARLLDESGQHPEALVDGVASPGGTTIAALTVLEAAGVRAAFADAVSAAVKRAEELGA